MKQNGSILIVEDEHTLRRLLEFRLSKQYRVRSAGDGKEALELIAKEQPDLILSDVRMPGMSGWEFHEELQRDPATRIIPFVFLTARDEPEDVWRGRRSGADDYITKPFDVEHLLIRVATLIERSQYFRADKEKDQTARENLNVFLCHAKEDKESVRSLYDDLIRVGVSPWMDDRDLVPGQNWELEIRKALRRSHVVLVCLSRRSTNKRGYVQKELRFALDASEMEPEGAIYIIPARIEECDVPERLRQTQWVDLHKDEGLDRLVHALSLRAATLGLKEPAVKRA